MVAGVDIGGTNIAAALASDDGVVVGERSIPTRSHEGPQAVLARVAEMLRQIGPATAVGVGLPGTLDRASGIVRFLPNMTGQWRNVPAGPILRDALDVPVHLLNDARMATLGELTYGSGRDVSTMAMFTLGTGVGGGVVVDRKLILGPLGAAGEVGHQTILPDGPLCGCGNRGCLETLVSGPAITGQAIRTMQSGLAPKLHEMTGGDVSRVTPREVAAASASDPALKDLMAQIGEYLGIAIANLINILHPELIVFGGGVAAMGDTLLQPVRAAVIRRVGMFPADNVRIERASLGDQAGVYGGIALALQQGKI